MEGTGPAATGRGELDAADGARAAAPGVTEERTRPGPEGADLVAVGVAELRRRALALGFGFVALAVLALLIAIYWQLGHAILWASTLAVLVYPVHRRILTLVGGNPGVAAAISTLVSLAVIFIPSVLGGIHLVGEVRNLWPALRDSLGPEAFERAAGWIEESRLRPLANIVLGGDPGGSATALQARLQDLAGSVQEFLLQRIRAATRSVPEVVVQFGITIMAYYFFLKHGPGWSDQIQAALPLEKAHARRLFDIVGQTINVVFRGVILTAVAQAALAGLGFWAAGAPTPLLLSVVTFVAALIPFVGPAFVWVPTAIGLYVAGRTGAAVGLALWGLLVVSLVDNFLRPYLIGREMKLPLLWLFLSIIGGLKLLGVLGVIVGPATLALAFACYRIYREGRRISEDEALSGRISEEASPPGGTGLTR